MNRYILGKTVRHYFKNISQETVEQSYTMPNLTDNTSQGFTVSDDGNRGGPAWKALATTSGYTSGYYSGKYRNESSTTYSLVIQCNDMSLVCTGYTFYTASVNSNSDWNTAWKSGKLYGSNDGVNWTELHSHGSINRNTTANFSFENTVAYEYYKYVGTSTGSGHKDQINYSSFHLTGVATFTAGSIVETDKTDYDFYVDRIEGKHIKLNNKYYVVKG